jgi:N-acetylglucosaminyldiphosphoundecaprenol N-acetyl-beta-D-mannosaminyltransferase
MNDLVLKNSTDTAKESNYILGLPFDNVDMTETIDQIFMMINQYTIYEKPRLVASVNVDNLVMANALFAGDTPRHPEMLHILRNADLVTADGMPIVWLSNILGNKLKERVAGADLIPALCKTAAERNARIFLLGGTDEVTREAANKLQADNPGLNICGIATPHVKIEGEEIDDEINDIRLVKQINEARPDILFIGFGNPKQLVWFNRNRDRLQVPVSIGIGGAFDFLAGKVKRAPVWMQKNGLEWVYRLSQDPKRLWKRYFNDLFKFSFMALPVVVGKYREKLFGSGKKINQPESHMQSGIGLDTSSFIESFNYNGRLHVQIILPETANSEWLNNNIDLLNHHINSENPVILDFAKVDFIDTRVISYLANEFNKAENDDLYGIKMNNESVIGKLKAERVYELFSGRLLATTPDVLKQLNTDKIFSDFYYLLNYTNETTVLRLFGRLDFAAMRQINFDDLFDVTLDKTTVIDMSNLDFVDSTGLVFFIKLKKYLENSNQQIYLSNLNDVTRQIFRITKLDQVFEISSDVKKVLKKTGSY